MMLCECKTGVNMAKISIKDLLDAGIHFGHRKNRWNPKMSEYIFGHRNGIHIIDLQQTVPLLHNALVFLYEIANNNGKILSVDDILSEINRLDKIHNTIGNYFLFKKENKSYKDYLR